MVKSVADFFELIGKNLDWLNAFQGFFFVGLPSAEQTTLYSDSRGIPCNLYMMLDQII